MPFSIKNLLTVVNVIGMTKMTPPIKDLLPRLTPILKNRHEKVQESCIDLVGRIADRGAEFVLQTHSVAPTGTKVVFLTGHSELQY